MNDLPKQSGGTERDTRQTRGDMSFRMSRVFVSLRNPVFRRYVLSLLGYWAPMQMYMVTLSLLVYRLSGSGTLLGLTHLANAVPMIILTLYGGVLADRVEKRQLLVYGQLASVVLIVAVGLSLSTGYLSAENPGSWWVFPASNAMLGAIFGIIMPARISMIPDIVPAGELTNAISLNNLGMNVFRIIAPAFAGIIIDTWGFAAVFYVMAGMYLYATVFLLRIPRIPPRPAEGRSSLHEIVEGVRYMKRETTILLIISFTLLCTILGQPFNMLLPMFTEDILQVSATMLGLLTAVSGVGAIIVSFFLATMPDKKRGLYMVLMGLLTSVALIGFSFTRSWYPALIISVFIGFGQTGQLSLGTTLVQYYVDPVFRGRVMSFQVLGFGLSSLGVLFGGILAESLGITWSIGGLAMALAVIAALILLFGRRLRAMD